ncbi:Spy/CpxP family protein refolding chaperone [Neptunomonas japonica]|uniref:Periplasmic protein CpxP n=1 Tax=Neptunomonas japonica JAMM 1380 TaxID=1441457 RepID=A0A7R6P6D1_9GAMM|nr:Spy/CpxP family protein refolding chaperone [Neptunomonas japonica]BBB28173.1 periplasmic protein CpxP [Neptunomonas japonica JAMM 1380]
MKKLTIALLTLPVLLVGTTVIAGMQHEGFSKCDRDGKMEKYDQKDRSKYMVKKMSKKLGLSDTQQEEVQKLFSSKHEQRQKMHTQMRTLHQATRDLDPNAADYDQQLAKTKTTAADMAVNKVEQQVNMKTEMAKILTEEQMSKLDDMRANFGEGRGKHH